ncbi:LysR family transcriptional regulator [Gluconobacter cerinus]|uniref:LysR family transcriptional regulator n=1 Tax=Gluconobacter cerinus TaxID=38307 RepID=A0A1B6VKP7_9PROT|nr:LysR family transcriptional regulator [Gluconobacter cerinus]OAJ67799.1 LysR family transcriptional regulator [Gluconobacter cerinus]
MKDQTHLDPMHLQSFLAVAETLHFTSAAQMLGVSQSTISQHVSRLEEQLSTRLLARSTKAVRLTENGTALVSLGQRLLQVEDSLFAYFRDGTPRGTIRLGVTEDLLLTRFPEILGVFRTAHPSLQITMTIGLSASLTRLLDNDEIDLLCGMRRSSETHGQKLWTEELRWFGPAQTPFSDGQSIPLVTFPEGSVTRRLAIEALNRAELPWHIAFTSGNLSAILAAVRAGYGITAQPGFLRESDGLSLCEMPSLPRIPNVDFIAATRHQTAQGPEELLIQTLCDHISRLQSSPPA